VKDAKRKSGGAIERRGLRGQTELASASTANGGVVLDEARPAEVTQSATKSVRASTTAAAASGNLKQRR